MTSAATGANAAGLARLARLADQRQDLEADITRAVGELRRRGVSWADIGRVLGLTRQAVRQRYQWRKPDEA
jgi:hypothetical protein